MVVDMTSGTNELDELLQRQNQIQQNLLNLERQIYEYEGSYLEDTQVHGNIVRGFEGFLSTANPQEKRPVRKFNSAERMFSMSSCTSSKAVEGRAGPGSPQMEKKKGGIYKRKPLPASAKGRDGGPGIKKARARQKDTDEEVDI